MYLKRGVLDNFTTYNLHIHDYIWIYLVFSPKLTEEFTLYMHEKEQF